MDARTWATIAHAPRGGVGTRLVAVAVEQARAAGCEWSTSTSSRTVRSFYFDACGFTPIDAGVIALR